MKSHETATVTGAVILEHGKWPELKNSLDPIIRDPKLKKLVVATSDSSSIDAVRLYTKMYKEKIILVEEGHTAGRALLFSRLIDTARNQSTDYVLLLDNQGVPQDGLIASFFDNFKYFKEEQFGHVVMIANTIDIFGEEKSFYRSTVKKDFKDGTVFDIISIQKIKRLLQHIFHIGNQTSTLPIFKTQSYVGSGTLIPQAALISTPLPDASLYMYGEDTEYAWNLKKNGFSFYQCLTPIIRRPSSERSSHHVFGLFTKATPDHEVYFHMRNAVLISRRNSYQSKPILFINIATWVVAACFLGILKTRSIRFFFHRFFIIVRAVLDGYRGTTQFRYLSK